MSPSMCLQQNSETLLLVNQEPIPRCKVGCACTIYNKATLAYNYTKAAAASCVASARHAECAVPHASKVPCDAMACNGSNVRLNRQSLA